MADFQELGIKLEAIDNASDKLQKVVDLLEKIKKLSGTGGGSTTVGGGSNTNNITRQASSLQNIASLYGKLKVAAEGATNAEIALINAQNREIVAAENYKNAQNKKAQALERLAAAQERLKAAQSDYNIWNTDNSQLSEEQRQRKWEINDIVEGGDTKFTERQLASAKRELASAQNAVVTATQSENSAYASLISAQNGVATATNNLRKEQEKQEQQTKKNTNSFVKFAAKMTAVVAVVRRLAKSLFSAVEESAAFVENLNLFAVTFGDNYQETLDWALDFAENLGVAANEVVRFTGLFKQLSDSIGIADEMGDQMSQTLTQLGYDRKKLSLYTVMCIEKPCERTNVRCEQYQIAC